MPIQYDRQLFKSKSNRMDNPTELTLRDFANVNAALDTANAFKFLSGKEGEDRFGTAPIRAAYFVLAHTLEEATLDTLNGFINSWNYKVCVVLKSSLIDSEARQGDEAQAKAA